MKPQIYKFLLSIIILVSYVALVYNFTQKPLPKITPLTYSTTKSLKEFNQSDIDSYQTSSGTFDLQTMSSYITSEIENMFLDSTEKALPLIGSWGLGTPDNRDGFDPMSLINRLTYGEHIVPAWKLDPYYNNSINFNYYEESIKKAAELKLPLIFILPSLESALVKDDLYFNMGASLNPNVITVNDTVLPKLSPLGNSDLWNEVGEKWSTTSLMQQIQEWYPNPPQIIFIDEENTEKLLWSELSTSKRYIAEYGTDKSDEFKQTLVNAQWIEKYRKLHEGFKQGLTKEEWKNNVRFISRNQLATNMGTTNNWMESSTTTNQYLNVWPYIADGLTIDFDLDSNKTDAKINPPHILFNNLPYMLEEAKILNSDFITQLSIDDNNKITSNDRYRGYIQFALWFVRPNIVRYTPNDISKEEINASFQQLVDSVELIYSQQVLTDFWKYGKLVSSGNSDLNLNIPLQYQTIPRKFLLDTNSDEVVWSFALEKGIAPNREWLVYAQSPEGNVTNINIIFPEYGEIPLDSSQKGNFYLLKESFQNIAKINDSLSPEPGITTDSAQFTPPESYVNVLDYGAVGDGVTDNTSAFNAAFAAHENVYVPAGDFHFDSYIFIKSTNKIIFGEGTLEGYALSSTAGEGFFRGAFPATLSDLTINGLTIKGSLSMNGTSLQNITIQNCHFKGEGLGGTFSNGILFVAHDNVNIDNITIQNNKFTDITRFATEFLNRHTSDPSYALSNFTIKNNYYTGITPLTGDAPNGGANYAISFSGNVYESAIIEHNYIEGFNAAFEIMNIADVRYNKSRNCRITFSGIFGIDDMKISNNYFENLSCGVKSQVREGTFVYENNICIGSFYFLNFDGLTIRGNKIYVLDTTVIPVYIDKSSNVEVYDNYIESHRSSSVYIIGFYNDNDINVSIHDNSYYTPDSSDVHESYYSGVGTQPIPVNTLPIAPPDIIN